MKNLEPASTVDAPYLDKEAARQMTEFEEGKNSANAGVSITDCPYAISKVRHPDSLVPLSGAEWRLAYENRFQAWLYGFHDAQSGN